jgi:hypothetical protein
MLFAGGWTHLQTYKLTNLQTYKLTNLQTYKLTNLQTYKLTNLQSYKLTNLQTYKLTNLQTYTQMFSQYSGISSHSFGCLYKACIAPNPKILNDLKPSKEQFEKVYGGMMTAVNELQFQIDSKSPFFH